LYIVHREGTVLWKFEKFCLEQVRWSQADLSWETEKEGIFILRLEYVFNGKIYENIYRISNGKPESSSVIYLTPIPKIDQP
jgi:hypothetical protein